jgi:hypothetical protein
VTVLANDFAPGWCPTTSHGAMEPHLSEKAGPVTTMPYRPAYLRHRRTPGAASLRAQLAEIHDALDALDRGLIEAGLTASRADARVDQVLRHLRKTEDLRQAVLCGEQDERDPDPCYEISEHEERDAAVMPHGHPESLVNELARADEDELGAYAAELWPRDEYAEITAEDWRERGAT